jgi:serine/threonine-protein kinase
MLRSIDRYTVEAILGEGAMGRVYRALDPRLGRRVALKVLLTEGESREARADAAARMVREARAAAAFNHPNVVAIYDVGETDGTPYIAMELVTGSSLRGYVGVNAGVTAAQKIAWLLDVARGLGAAHRVGLVHRDIKPENVMITADGIVKILDFGIARQADQAIDAIASTAVAALPALTGGGVVVGTLQYMAPEQIRMQALDGRTDQFAWAVLAYELLTGVFPWGPVTSGVTFVGAVLERPARPLHELLPGVRGALSDAIGRALSKSPDARFASMEDLVSAIDAEGASAGAAVAPPLGAHSSPRASTLAPPRAERPARKLVTRARVSLAAGVAGALAIAGAVEWAARDRAPTVAPAATSAPRCTTNAGCTAAAGHPSVCRRADGACVALASEDCEALATPEEQADEGAVWFGVLLPRRPPRGPNFTRALQVLELARSDFRLVGGLPARARDARTRPLGLLVCDDTVDARRASAHLVDVGVPAVMGFGLLSEAIDLSTNVFVPRHILVCNITSSNPLATRIAQPAGEPRLVWRSEFSMAAKGEAVSRLVSDYVEPWLRRPGGPVVGSSPLRVMLVRSSEANPRAFGETIVDNLRMNGKPVIENPESFRQTVYPEGASEAQIAAAVAEVIAFAPHVILYTSADVFQSSLLEPIEKGWKGAYRPLYVSHEILAGEGLRRFVGKDASRRRRFLGVEGPANTVANLNFVSHFNELYTPGITPGTAPGTVYDAFYALAFAAGAAEGDLTGTAMAEGMQRIRPDGVRVRVGPTEILGAFAALRQGASIALDGAGTELDIDVTTGELRSDFAVYCLKQQPDGKDDAVESGLRIDHRAGRIVGAFHCE